MSAVKGCAAVVTVRLASLREAIRAKDWERTEWEFDRVQSAQSKLVEKLQARESVVAPGVSLQVPIVGNCK